MATSKTDHCPTEYFILQPHPAVHYLFHREPKAIFPPRHFWNTHDNFSQVSDIKQQSESVRVVAADDASGAGRPFLREEQDTVELLNQGYVCPAHAGPAWRAAMNAGVDMGLVEDSLLMPPEDRLREHQRALNQILAMTQGRSSHDSGS